MAFSLHQMVMDSPLDYRQMYELIFILSHYDYEKENLNHK